jgi:bifunctional oligoribonuclease and PAP phosphatase NrnA
MASLFKKQPRIRLLADHRDTVRHITDALAASKRVLIGTHEHPDGDALGSSLALLHILEAQGKEVVAYIPDPAPDFFSFLPGIDKLTTTKPSASDFDTIVLLDYTQLYRTHLEEEVLAHPMTICIDHHYDNSRQTKINLVVPEAAATAHILFEMLTMADWPITKDVATCLLTGIFTDTGSFMHDSVTPEILEISSALMNKGARLSHIAHETYQKKDLASLRIWGRALSRISTNEKTGASMSVVTYDDLQECGATLDDLSGVVNMLNTLPQTKYAMLLVEHEPGNIKGSLRSEPHKGVNVSKIAKRLGGGGHKLASGFEVQGHLIEQDGTWRVVKPSHQ